VHILNFAMGAILHRYATGCEFPCRRVEWVYTPLFLRSLTNFAVVNCADEALSVFYFPVSTSCRIFSRFCSALT